MRTKETVSDWRSVISFRLTLGLMVLATAASVVGVIFNQELYFAETGSVRAQVFGQDVVNLVFAIPVLAWSVMVAKKGSVRGRLVWLAVLFYFLYTYLSYVMLSAHNRAFPLHVALAAMALYALLLGVSTIDIGAVRVETSRRIVRYTPHILGFFLFTILLLWMPEIMASAFTGETPARLVTDGTRTHVIAAQDLIMLFPLGLLSIYLLRVEERPGLILAPIVYVKAVTLAISVLGMIGFMTVAGTPPALPEVGMFVMLTAVFSYATVQYLRCVGGHVRGTVDDGGSGTSPNPTEGSRKVHTG